MVSDDEAAHVTVIFCQEAGIVSLKGIERFPNLRVLNCIRNHISSLDLSANRALETLWCHDNPLVELDVSRVRGTDGARLPGLGPAPSRCERMARRWRRSIAAITR